jgi:hypothetical protein
MDGWKITSTTGIIHGFPKLMYAYLIFWDLGWCYAQLPFSWLDSIYPLKPIGYRKLPRDHNLPTMLNTICVVSPFINEHIRKENYHCFRSSNCTAATAHGCHGTATAFFRCPHVRLVDFPATVLSDQASGNQPPVPAMAPIAAPALTRVSSYSPTFRTRPWIAFITITLS